MILLQYIDALLFVMAAWMLIFSFSCTPWGARLFSSRSRIDRLFLSLFVAGFVVAGWTKGPVTPEGARPLFNFIMALRGGGITGDDGVLARKAELETIAAYLDYSDAMISSGSNALADANARFDAAEQTLLADTSEIVYIQCFFPRSDPTAALTNHNIAVLAMQQTTVSNVLSRWIYFSDELAQEPTLYAEVDLGGGWTRLEQITNSWPSTELVQDVPCVRYDYRLPDALSGLVVAPDFDLRFGSELNGLQIGEGGTIVTDNTGDNLGYDETDNLFNGRVKVHYRSGVAVRVDIDGQTVTNGVYSL